MTPGVDEPERSLAFYRDGLGLPSEGIVGQEFEFGAVAQAERAGARIVKRACPTSWGGYADYCADPDGHLWEIGFNPSLRIDG